jgi:hypothetical protein
MSALLKAQRDAEKQQMSPEVHHFFFFFCRAPEADVPVCTTAM